MFARMEVGLVVLHVQIGNNYTFLSCYEATGWLFKAGAAGTYSLLE